MAKYVIERRFSTFFRPRGRDKISQLLGYAGVETNPEVWLGSRLLMILLFGLIGSLLPFSIFPFIDLSQYLLLSDTSLPARIVVSLGSGVALSLLVALLVYMHLYYLISERSQRVEAVLPDFLLMVAANLRAGMTPFAAFQASARPEFGPLQSEILYVSSRSLGSESFAESLKGLTTNIDSAMLRRMIAFFENELRSGGKLAYLLETSAEEIRETEEVKAQMMVATKTYAIFLVFILLFGLPLLLAISTQFLIIFSKFQSNLGTGDTSAVQGMSGISSPKMKVDVNFIEQMAYLVILGTSLLTTIMIGVISEGKTLYGLKYFPPLAAAAMVFFLIFKTVIGGFVGSLI